MFFLSLPSFPVAVQIRRASFYRDTLMYLVIIKRGFLLPLFPLEHVLQLRVQLRRYFSGKRNIRQRLRFTVQKTFKKTKCVFQESDGRQAEKYLRAWLWLLCLSGLSFVPVFSAQDFTTSIR